ncbi:MAG: AraC family transcriptional regulator [Cohnella sp.]|nr:AraC family transcriptional regulator [Cohnella sp.]
MSETSYASVGRALNEKVIRCMEGGVEFRIHYWGMVWSHYDNPVHRHSFYEVCYVLDGSGEYEDEGDTFALHSGSQWVSIPGHWHQIRSENGLQIFYVAFELVDAERENAAVVSYETALRCSERPVIQDHENVSALLWRALFRQAQDELSERVQGLAGMLIGSFAAVFGPENKAVVRDHEAPRSSSQMVEMAIRFVRDNLSRTLKLKDVASYLHVSDRHLSRMFGKYRGETFGECLTRERLQLADTLLKTTVYAIKQISEQTGFQSVHYFTRVFTEHFGLPPAAYRRKSMNDQDERPR